jgi:predicted MFS family arabinose efflux permease
VAVTGSSLALIVVGPLAPRLMAVTGPDGWRHCWTLFGGLTLLVALVCWLAIRDRPGEPLADLGSPYGRAPVAPPAGLQWGLVYRARPVWHLGLVYVAFGFSYMIYLTFFVKRLVAEGGYNKAAAGDLFMTLGWASLVCGVLWGWLSDRLGRRAALVAIYLVQALAYGLFALWPTPTGFTLSALLFGITAWSIPAVMAAACGDVLGPRLAPAALGFITLFFGIGQALGPGVAGAMADASGSFAPAYLLAMGVALLGAGAAATLRPPVAVADRDGVTLP